MALILILVVLSNHVLPTLLYLLCLLACVALMATFVVLISNSLVLVMSNVVVAYVMESLVVASLVLSLVQTTSIVALESVLLIILVLDLT